MAAPGPEGRLIASPAKDELLGGLKGYKDAAFSPLDVNAAGLDEFSPSIEMTRLMSFEGDKMPDDGRDDQLLHLYYQLEKAVRTFMERGCGFRIPPELAMMKVEVAEPQQTSVEIGDIDESQEDAVVFDAVEMREERVDVVEQLGFRRDSSGFYRPYSYSQVLRVLHAIERVNPSMVLEDRYMKFMKSVLRTRSSGSAVAEEHERDSHSRRLLRRLMEEEVRA